MIEPKNGRSLKSQKTIVHHFAKKDRAVIEHEFVESNNEKKTILKKAINYCQKHGTILIVAKLDGLSLHIDELFKIKKKLGDSIKCCDLPTTTAFRYESNSSIKPDMTFKLKPNEEELYLFELENGRNSKKSIQKCIRHGEAVLTGIVNQKYNFNKGYRLLWVFENKGALKTTQKELEKLPRFQNLGEYFLFKPLPDFEKERCFISLVESCLSN